MPTRFIKPSPVESVLFRINLAYKKKKKAAIGRLGCMEIVIYIGINVKTVDFSHLPERLPRRLYRHNSRELHEKCINNFINNFEIISIRPINTQ